jgi:DNA-binding transcriptional MerR regulator
MLGIGDFSRFTMLSVRMLRHYDQRGLLRPAHVDPSSGYRYYSADQLQTAARIRTLRDAGCGIGQIAELLPLFGRTQELREALDAHARSLDEAARQIADQRALVESITEQINDRSTPIVVGERRIPTMRTLSLRRIIPNWDAEGGLWHDFGTLLSSGDGPLMARLGKMWGATYWDAEYREAECDISVWVDLLGDYEPPPPYTVEELPEARVAWATLFGSYDLMPQVTEAIGQWITDRGLCAAGPGFTIFVVSPAQDPNPDNWVTEVNYPVAPASASAAPFASPRQGA